MLDISLALIYFATVIAIISTPGPVVMLVVNSSLRDGFGKGVKTIAGTNLSSLILMSAAILVIYGIIAINAVFLNFLRLFGCLYLIYIALESFMDLWKTRDATVTQGVIKESGGFMKGFYVGISNPKDIIFFASLFPQFILISPIRWVGLSVLSLGWIVLDWVILMAYVTVLSKFVDGRYKNTIMFISSWFILAIGLVGLYKSVVDLVPVIN